jgi:fibronectin-binding autotransporter adhesin
VAVIEQVVGGLTLTNQSTIQGNGIIGNGGLAVVNDTGGTILANNAGTTLLINGSGGFTNNGSVHVSSGSTLQVANSAYTQNGGNTLVEAGGELNAPVVTENGGSIQVDGTLDPLSVHVFSPATLSGSGTIIADVTNEGSVILGDSVSSPGTLTVLGSFTQLADGTLVEGIDSLGNGVLSLDGNLSLAGTLDINLLGGFTPADSQIFELASFTGAESGVFSGIIGSDASDWTVLYNPGQVDLEFNKPIGGVPDTTSTLTLLGPGLVLLALLGRRSKLLTHS